MPAAAAATVISAAAPRIAAESQWVRTQEIACRSMSRAEQAGRLHVAAGEQIDAADYALRLLSDDLARLMTWRRDEAEEELDIRRYPQRYGRRAKPATAPAEAPAHAAA